MASAFINHVTIMIFAGLLGWAAVSDYRTYLIPNSVSLSIAALYPAYVIASPVPIDWPLGLAVGAGVLAVGFVLFALRYAGGGDVKLLAVVALWAGPGHVFPFLVLTTIAGGVLAFATATHLRYLRPFPALALAPDEASATKLQSSVPYGMAIALGGLWLVTQILV